MKVQLTPKAEQKLLEALKEGKYYRVILQKSGCCGYGFVFSQGRKLSDDIVVTTEHGVGVPVTLQASHMLKNVIIDYKRRGLRMGFLVIPDA